MDSPFPYREYSTMLLSEGVGCGILGHMPKNPKPDRQPGDLIIDRYLPDATPEERERARRELKGFAATLFTVLERTGAHLQDAPQFDSSPVSCEMCAKTQTAT